ncbi:glycolipid transfer protein [Teladorsagia circumcincta]|uniref:Glycolipid transfer protein n=1 Tax=Teladorsagia circumcincta TaxID=45464 RepID=A0A2G9UBL8_TELCI|nr:glycolipid transfer protein [Teladorsagia circumcincta]
MSFFIERFASPGFLGTAFSPVKADINGNVVKVRTRGLEFMLEMLTLMVQEYRSSADKSKTENLVGVINKAYEKSLKRHHGFMSKQLFKLVIHAAPYRRTILKAVALGKDGLDEVYQPFKRSIFICGVIGP